MDIENIKKSKNFCILPWVSMHLWPDGKMFPCCNWDSSEPLGNYAKNSLDELWNHPSLKELRVKMLNDEKTEACKRCTSLEEIVSAQTLRVNSNLKFDHLFSLVKETAPDGTIYNKKLAYLDFRFSNLCNLKCNTCGLPLSSSWYEDQIRIDHFSKDETKREKLQSLNKKGEIFNELKPHLNEVEMAYFAGGEPALCEEHYKIFDHWIESSKLDVNMVYVTNFTNLNFGKKSLLDYWNKFQSVTVFASLDDDAQRAEYLRKGTIWKNILNNRKKMLTQCPNVKFVITPTISFYNAFHFPEFHIDWIKKGLVDPDCISLNILTKPEFQSIRLFSKEKKSELIQIYKNAIKHIEDLSLKLKIPCNQSVTAYNSVIDYLNNFIDEQPNQDHIRILKERINLMDKIREENILEAYPELEFLIN